MLIVSIMYLNKIQVHETKSARVRAYIDLSTNFMCGRWLRLWPILQASVLLSLLWATFLTGSDDLAEEDLEPCKVRGLEFRFGEVVRI